MLQASGHKYSNLCALRLSWAAVRTYSGLSRLTANRVVPTVCIQMLSLAPMSHTAGGIMPGGCGCPTYWWGSPG